MSVHSVAVIPGDDSAPEAVRATLSVLEAMDLPINFDVLPEGSTFAAMDRAEGEALVRAAVDKSDTVLYGSTSGKTGEWPTCVGGGARTRIFDPSSGGRDCHHRSAGRRVLTM